MVVTLPFPEKLRWYEQTGHGGPGAHLGQDRALPPWEEHTPLLTTLPPPKGCSLLYHMSLTFTGHGRMGVPSLPMQHGEDMQAAASSASRSQRALWPRMPVGSAGSRMMGLQFPSKVSHVPGHIWVATCEIT